MNELTLNLDVHNKYGFYQIKNDIKCEFMELEGYYMRCNKDIEIFEKGKTYLIHSNCNDFIYYLNKEKLENIPFEVNTFEHECEKQNCFSLIPVEWFEKGICTLIGKRMTQHNE